MSVLDRLSLRARVAVLAFLVSATTLGVLGWWYIGNTSRAFSDATRAQATAFTEQTAPTIMGLLVSGGYEDLPVSANGISAVGVFAADGTLTASAGTNRRFLDRIAPEVRQAMAAGVNHQDFHAADGARRTRLRVRDGDDTLLVTVVPAAGGAVATASHVGWALDELRTITVVTIAGLALGSLLLTGMLVLVIGRYVTAPVERLAETDPLTGVANQRAFAVAVEAAVRDARAGDRPVSLIAIDVDGLKQVNDERGHLAGDRLITDVAAAARGAVRGDDVLARIGGDEFVILCPGLARPGALEVAARIEATLEASDLHASIGVADLPPGGTADDLRERADTALYAVKARRKALRLA